MKSVSLIRRVQELVIIFLLALALLPGCAWAQTLSTSSYGELETPYSQQELAQMLAPVALYPDPLLAQILMASTYPIEVVEAERWIQANPQLKDDALDAALLRRNWDPSVKAMTHFPSILTLMSERISETTELGNAFLAQEADVMAMVQDLRAQAYAQGNLKTDARQRVIVETETIIIQPVNPRVVYVPYYDPYYVYGSWRYSSYPPYYWGPAGVIISHGIGYWPGFYFTFTYGNWSYFDWPRRVIYIDVRTRPRFVHHEHWIVRTGTWKHAPVHRRGLAYHDHITAARFSQPTRAYASGRQDRHSSTSVNRQELNRQRNTSTSTRTQQQQVISQATPDHRSIQTTDRPRVVERDSTNRNRQQQRVTTNQQPVQSRQQSVQRTSPDNRPQHRQAPEQRAQPPNGQDQNRQRPTAQPDRQLNPEAENGQTEVRYRKDTPQRDTSQFRGTLQRNQGAQNSSPQSSRVNQTRNGR